MPSSEEKNNDQITEVKETRADRKPQADPALAIDPERLARMHENKKRFHRKRRIKDWAMFTGYLTPSLVGVMVFFFLPLLLILKTSFQRSSTNTDFVGIENYERVLTNEAFLNSAKNSLTFSGIAVPLSVVLALLLAILLNTKLPGESVFRSVLLNPMMVPVASVVLIWQVFFSYNGMANGWGLYKLFEDGRIDWLKSDHSQLVILALFLWKKPDVNYPVRRLSGGNVQKVLVGREIATAPSVLMSAYAVRGLDINTSYTIYNLMNQQKEKGVAVIFVGEDLDVLLELCDRILVLYDGRVSGIVNAREVAKEEVGLMMTRLGKGENADA